MPDSDKKNVVYLLGAGVTHSEKQLECKRRGVNIQSYGRRNENIGLLARDVSKRVVDRLLKKTPDLLSNHGITESLLCDSVWGGAPLDIELFISLLEAMKTEKSEDQAREVRKYFREDIYTNLKIGKKLIKPRLTPLLIKWHRHIPEEKLTGFLTLNYDSTLEESFKIVKQSFDYGFDINDNSSHSDNLEAPYVLKLHGSFDWSFTRTKNKIHVSSLIKNSDDAQWIPPRLNKEYLNYPYNIIHGRAYELLCQCDILRIIGCSLNQNDMGLISLLFKTQRPKRSTPYSIEIVGNPDRPKKLFDRLGMVLTFEDSFYYSYPPEDHTDNYFLDWLRYKILGTPNSTKDRLLKKLDEWREYEQQQ